MKDSSNSVQLLTVGDNDKHTPNIQICGTYYIGALFSSMVIGDSDH